MDRAAFFLLCLFAINLAGGQELPDVTTVSAEADTKAPPLSDQLNNKTVSELVQEQTDVIKKIISEQKLQTDDRSVVTKTETEKKDTSALKAEKEKQFIEELRLKCQHFFKLLTNSDEKPSTTTEKPRQTVQPFGPPIRPQFLNFRPKYPQTAKPKPPTGYFYIFSQNPTGLQPHRSNKLSDNLEAAGTTISEDTITSNPTTAYPEIADPTMYDGYNEQMMHLGADKLTQKLKYVRLEPLILQKTLLTNGKTLLHWYRMVPGTQSFIQIPDTPENEQVNTIAQPQTNPYQSVPLPEQYLFYVDPHTGAIIRNLQPKPATATPFSTTSSPGSENNHNRPQYYINSQNGLIYQPSFTTIDATTPSGNHQKKYQYYINPQSGLFYQPTSDTTTPLPGSANYQPQYYINSQTGLIYQPSSDSTTPPPGSANYQNQPQYYINPQNGLYYQPPSTIDTATPLPESPNKPEYYINPQTGQLYQPPGITTDTATPLPASANKPQYYMNPENGLIFPQYPNQRYAQETTTSTEPPTTTRIETTTTELPKKSIQYSIDYSQYDNFQDKYRNEYRFVLPMFMPGSQEASKYPSQVDPYAYLPKEQRPDLMNVAVPYVPNYQMIKAIAIPKKYQAQTDKVTY